MLKIDTHHSFTRCQFNFILELHQANDYKVDMGLGSRDVYYKPVNSNSSPFQGIK